MLGFLSKESESNSLKSLSYVIVPTRLYRENKCRYLQNLIFSFWSAHWDEAFAKTGNPDGHWREHFLRQDLVVALVAGLETKNPEVIGCHLYTFYDLDSQISLHSEYFNWISQPTRDALRASGFIRPMSMEYLSINSNWSRNSAGLGLGRLMVALGGYVSASVGASCALGMPIDGTKVDKMSENIGGFTIATDINKYGYKLQIVLMPTRSGFPRSKDEKTQKWVDLLWQARLDMSGLTLGNTERPRETEAHG